MNKNGSRKKNKGGEEMVTLTQEEKDFIDDLMAEAEEEDQDEEDQ
jgi:hypothetical protein